MSVLIVRSLDEIREIAVKELAEGTVLAVEFSGKEGDKDECEGTCSGKVWGA